MLKQDKVFYSSLIGILLNTVSFLMREHREVFLCPYQNPILFDPRHFGDQWKFSVDKHKSLQVDTERTFHQRYPLAML